MNERPFSGKWMSVSERPSLGLFPFRSCLNEDPLFRLVHLVRLQDPNL